MMQSIADLLSADIAETERENDTSEIQGFYPSMMHADNKTARASPMNYTSTRTRLEVNFTSKNI